MTLRDRLPLLEGESAWLVVPARAARTTAALDELLARAARACGASDLFVRDAVGDSGVHLVAIYAAQIDRLAAVMSLADHRLAGLHVAGERGAAAMFHDGNRTGTVRGTAREAATAAGEHLGVTGDELLAVAAAHAVTAQPRVARGRAAPEFAHMVCDTSVDDDFSIEIAARRLAPAENELLERFAAWDHAERAHSLAPAAKNAAGDATHPLLQLLPELPVHISLGALELRLRARGIAPERLAAFRAWLHGSPSP